MQRKFILTCSVLALISLAQAHEFWMQPDKFVFNPGERLVVGFKVGENFMGEPWNLKASKIARLELRQLSKSTSLLNLVNDTTKKGEVSIPLKDVGTHMVILQSGNAFIELEGEKFNAYLKEDGLDDVYAQRKKANTLGNTAREYYARYSKLLVQVGTPTDETFRMVAGFPIEIVPERNPYNLRKGDPVRFKILFEGKPLFGAKVKVWNRFDNRTTIQNIYTEKNGMIETHISNPGRWMVSVVKMVPSKQEGADWQSYWGSLVFGVEEK